MYRNRSIETLFSLNTPPGAQLFESGTEKLVRAAADEVHAELAAVYLQTVSESSVSSADEYLLSHWLGADKPVSSINPASELAGFVFDSREPVIVSRRETEFFNAIFLSDKMESGICFGLEQSAGGTRALLILNSKLPDGFTWFHFTALERLVAAWRAVYSDEVYKNVHY